MDIMDIAIGEDNPTIKSVPPLDVNLIPKTDLTEVDSTVFTWKIKDWSSLITENKVRSDEFTCGGFRWKILLFPSGNRSSENLSIFLESVDGGLTDKDYRWHACVQFGLAVQNPNDPLVYKFLNAQHRFQSTEIDWGFNQHVKTLALSRAIDDLPKPLTEGQAVNIVAVVRVVADPTGVLWHNFVDYDSKKETGFVGLRNQGATCYMNSLLQSLYFTNIFQKATFQIPTDNDQPEKSIPLALQRVFYNLKHSDVPVGTTELTTSFGWDTAESFNQHDVQEFNRVLQDALETKMKGTPAEGAISEIFKGKMKSYIKCVDIDFESSRVEDFYDVQLNVKGCPDLLSSFKEYCAVETLEDDNRYMAEGHGLQVAKKGVIFREFPKVFHMQLKRYEYDFERDVNVKINDRFEYPEELNLSDYLENPSSQDASYVLHGVLVHSGDVHGGHYCAFLRPDMVDKWYKFDDDRVIPVTKKDVFEENFGGEVASVKLGGRNYKNFTNAYMLVYIRKSELNFVLDAVTDEDIPVHLKSRLDEEMKLEAIRRKEQEEEHLHARVRILTDEDIAASQADAVDLYDFDNRLGNLTEIRALKSSNYDQFKELIAKTMNVKVGEFRLWPLFRRQNGTTRPDAPISDQEDVNTLESVIEKHMKSIGDMKLYLEQPDLSSASKGGPLFIPKDDPNQQGNFIIFIKYFDVENNRMEFLGKVTIKFKSAKISDLIPWVNTKVNASSGTNWKVFEEITEKMVDAVKPKYTYQQVEISDGDILIFQKDLSNDELKKLPDTYFKDTLEYYDFMRHRILVTFRPHGTSFDTQSMEQPTSPQQQQYTLVLSKKFTQERVLQSLAEVMKVDDPSKIRLLPIRNKKNMTLQELIGYVGYGRPNILDYELLSVSTKELENKRLTRVYFMNSALHERGPEEVIIAKNVKVEEVLNSALQNVPSNQRSQRYVFYERFNHRICRIFKGDEVLQSVPEGSEFVVQEIANEDIPSFDQGAIVPVFHFYKELSRTHHSPFVFVLRSMENFNETKERLFKNLNLTERETGKLKLSMAVDNKIQYLEEKNNEVTVTMVDLFASKKAELGLDHPERSSSRFSLQEKAIKIFSS